MKEIRLLLAALSLITIAACGDMENVSSTTSGSPTSISPNGLTGTWTTDPQPRDAWDSAFHKYGGDAAKRFDLGRGMKTAGTVILTFSEDKWTESQRSDDSLVIVGSRGTYILDDTKLRLTESVGYNDYELARGNGSIKLTWLRQRRPDPGVATTKTLFTGFLFHQAEQTPPSR